jgi:hypothetical protein
MNELLRENKENVGAEGIDRRIDSESFLGS